MRPRQRRAPYVLVAVITAVAGVCAAGGDVSGARGSADAAWSAGTILGGSGTTSVGAASGGDGVQVLRLPRLGDILLTCRPAGYGSGTGISFLFRASSAGPVWVILAQQGPAAVVPVGSGQTVSIAGGPVPAVARLATSTMLATVTLTSRSQRNLCMGSAQAMLNSTTGDYGSNAPAADILAGSGIERGVGPAAPFDRARVASVRDTKRLLVLPQLGEIRLACWKTLDSTRHNVFTETAFYVRNTQKSQLLIESDSLSPPQLAVRAGAFTRVTGRMVIRTYKHGVFPALFRVTGGGATATVVTSGTDASSRCAGTVQAIVSPSRGDAARAGTARRGTVLAGTATSLFAGAAAKPVPVLSLPGLGEVGLSCAPARPGPGEYPRIDFSFRNTQSHSISVISDSEAQIVTAHASAVVRLPGVTVITAVGHLAVGPEISEIWDSRKVATLTLTGNLASNGELVSDVARALNAGAINGCLGLAQAALNR